MRNTHTRYTKTPKSQKGKAVASGVQLRGAEEFQALKHSGAHGTRDEGFRLGIWLRVKHVGVYVSGDSGRSLRFMA